MGCKMNCVTYDFTTRVPATDLLFESDSLLKKYEPATVRSQACEDAIETARCLLDDDGPLAPAPGREARQTTTHDKHCPPFRHHRMLRLQRDRHLIVYASDVVTNSPLKANCSRIGCEACRTIKSRPVLGDSEDSDHAGQALPLQVGELEEPSQNANPRRPGGGNHEARIKWINEEANIILS